MTNMGSRIKLHGRLTDKKGKKFGNEIHIKCGQIVDAQWNRLVNAMKDLQMISKSNNNKHTVLASRLRYAERFMGFDSIWWTKILLLKLVILKSRGVLFVDFYYAKKRATASSILAHRRL